MSQQAALRLVFANHSELFSNLWNRCNLWTAFANPTPPPARARGKGRASFPPPMPEKRRHKIKAGKGWMLA